MQCWQEQQLSGYRGAYRDSQASDRDGIAQDAAAASVDGSVQSETVHHCDTANHSLLASSS